MSEIYREEKMRKEILVVPTGALLDWVTARWFISHQEIDLESKILANMQYKVRWDMEHDPSYQQPIPYGIVRNPETRKIVWYKRWDASSINGEERIHGKWSVGVWGHIEKLEVEWESNPLYATILQEVEEEIHLSWDQINNVKLLWYIKLDGGVEEYHLWVIYLISTQVDDVSINDWEIAKVHMLSLHEIETIIDSSDAELERWSELVVKNFDTLIS